MPDLFLAESPKNQDASAHQGQAARVAGSRCGSAFAFIANMVITNHQQKRFGRE
jgi:hypothetical protein